MTDSDVVTKLQKIYEIKENYGLGWTQSNLLINLEVAIDFLERQLSNRKDVADHQFNEGK